jgi:hypothetical protein
MWVVEWRSPDGTIVPCMDGYERIDEAIEAVDAIRQSALLILPPKQEQRGTA